MKTFIVTYDVAQTSATGRQRTADQVYEALYAALKGFGTWAHITESC